MNPWAIVLLVLAIIAIIVAVKGTQDKIIAGVTGRPYKGAQ